MPIRVYIKLRTVRQNAMTEPTAQPFWPMFLAVLKDVPKKITIKAPNSKLERSPWDNNSKYARVVIIRAAMGTLIPTNENPESIAFPNFSVMFSTPSIGFVYKFYDSPARDMWEPPFWRLSFCISAVRDLKK